MSAEQTNPQSPAARYEQFMARVSALAASDPQFGAAMPSPNINEIKTRPELGLAQIIASCMEGYAERPAVAERATELVTDPATGRSVRNQLKYFEAVSYRELWARVRALANVWYHDKTKPLVANDLICILAFAGTDFATVDLAALHNGAVVVPLQTNASIQQLLGIFTEITPNWLATSIDYLPLGVELVLQAHRPLGILLFDYHPEVDSEREILEAAQAKLAAAGLPDLITTLDTMRARGETLPAAPLFAEPNTDQRMSAIYYTSGSTGLPKGAMITERMIKMAWNFVSPIPLIQVNYLPLNHTMGRANLFAALSSGGICHFTAKSDLSELFDDIRMARPTLLSFVPRVCEMVYQHYQVELERRTPGVADSAALKQELYAEIRDNLLGGRVMSCIFASAALAPELGEFMQSCLGFPLDDNYGATEVGGVLRNNRVQRPPVLDYKLDDVPELGYFKTDKPHPRGELLVKTRNVMLGYYKRPEVTAGVFDADGYYRTGDIMAEIEPDHLVYLDRRNNVLKLAQGEFVAIARLEALFTNGDPLIRQAFLYGTSERAFLLGVFVPSEDALRRLGIADDAAAIKAALRDAINQVAQTEQLNAYEIPRDFIVEHEPFSVENGLLAGIGKYQRPKFKERYAPRLEQLYDDIASTQAEELQILRREGRNAPVLETLRRALQATLGLETLDLSTPCSFAQLGGDSLSALSCSLLLQDIYEIDVPASVINSPSGTLQQLAEFIERGRENAHRRASFASVHGRGATEIHASDLTLDKFIDADTLANARKAAPPADEVRTVLLTGANGYLGRFLCLEWLERMSAVGGRVICIARGQDATAAYKRIAAAFDSGDVELKQHFEQLAAKHLEVLAGDIGEPDLGLSYGDWQRLATSVDVIVHPAAFVNHVLPYQQLFGANVVGTAELIRLALTQRLKPIHNVSTVAAAMLPDGVMDEEADVRTVTPVRRLGASHYADGYANSKWAGEVLLRDAHERFGLPVAVFRSDMILAHSRFKGQINVPDMFTRWLFSVVVTGLAPRSFYTGDLAKAHYDGLPADFSAKAIATLGASAREGYRTYHVVNPHDDGVSLDRFVDWAIAAGYPIRRIDDYADWLDRFKTALRGLPEKQRQQSSLPLLHQLAQPMPAEFSSLIPAARFREAVRQLGVGAHKDIPHLSDSFIRKCLSDIHHLHMI